MYSGGEEILRYIPKIKFPLDWKSWNLQMLHTKFGQGWPSSSLNDDGPYSIPTGLLDGSSDINNAKSAFIGKMKAVSK